MHIHSSNLKELEMTDFRKIDLTIASTRGDTIHSVGFNVLITDWENMKVGLKKLDPNTLEFREEDLPRGNPPCDGWRFVWVVMTKDTPLNVLLYLGSLSEKSYPAIQLLPREYP